MPKPRARMILTFVTTAAAICGAGKLAEHALIAKPAAPPAVTPAPAPAAAHAPAPAVQSMTVSRPLVNASGRPACGNVTSRAPQQHCERLR